MKQYQREVEEFMEKHDMEGPTAFLLIDLFAEIGEVASDAAKSSDYGTEKEQLEVKEDEFGDVLFSLFALANDLNVDMEQAFETAMSKYQDRIEEKGDASSK